MRHLVLMTKSYYMNIYIYIYIYIVIPKLFMGKVFILAFFFFFLVLNNKTFNFSGNNISPKKKKKPFLKIKANELCIRIKVIP